MKMLLYLIHEDDGQGLAEYSLIISLIALVVIGVVRTFGENVLGLYDDIVSKWP